MAINETLKFSWGHIIAFAAIIFISYVSFMGISYLADGNFLLAGVGVVVIDVLLLVFFICAQLLKGTDEKFKKRIIFERILLFSAPIVFCVVMIPYSHFWTVFAQRDEIEKTYSSSLKETKGMFDTYESYADARIKDYDTKLARDKVPQPSRQNRVNALKLQLVSDNFNNLKIASCQWIDNASKATVWNVFMLGNIQKIKDALEDWNKSLTAMSQKKMSDEAEVVSPFTSEDPSVIQANKDLSSLNVLYSKLKAPSWIAIVTGIFLMLMLLFPYLIQNRNTKSIYRLIGTEDTGNKHIAKKAQNRIKKEHPEESSFELKFPDSTTTGDYESFNM